ncbi:MAG TPA: hypothetical protein ENH82_08410 [bacterium]|nr:hypothetical protein [bacterium]
MKRIPLTQGQFAIVDDEDFEWLTQHKWCACWNKHAKSFYAVRSEKGEDGEWHQISMAREILRLKRGDKQQADHINCNTLDNQLLSNLRIVTHQQNGWNRKNSKGYYFCKPNQKYFAHIGLNGKRIYLGLFHTSKEAHGAYLKAKEVYHKF